MSCQCFCGSHRSFSRCCEPYLLGTAAAPTAESLMRSRYSAFCTGHVNYLLATHHLSAAAEDQAASERDSILQTIGATEWINLLVIGRQKGQKKDKTGVVEFVAAYRPRLGPAVNNAASRTANSANSAVQLHERSRFIREKGRWFYLEGEILPPYQPKLSHLCWCGSKKPFKYCHGHG